VEDETLVPGEPEQRARARRLSEGVPVSTETWGILLETARSVGLSEQRIGQTRATPAQILA